VLLASIPSPSSGNLHLGPLTIHMYGVMLLLGIVAAIALTGYRWTRRGGDWDLVFQAAVWGVAAGVVGARLYHDVTSWNEVPHTWWGPFAVWQGGLGIWGGITFGGLAGALVVRRAGASVTLMMDCVAPALLLAQAIGRWGNYWNQELFGKPTSLPWGLEIDPDHRPEGYVQYTTFHPTFLYESLWDLAVFVALMYWLRPRWHDRPGALFFWYIGLYSVGRFAIEAVRVDSFWAGGYRVPQLASVAGVSVSVCGLVWVSRRARTSAARGGSG